MKVYVLGGGASGMVAAIASKRLGNDVTIIEKNSLGKKLLLTGNGRCNYYNDDMSISKFNSKKAEKFINQTNLKKVLEFFDSIGVVPNIKDGYYYPYSNTSYAILNALEKEIKVLGINIINEEVSDIKDGFIITNSNKYKYDKVILSLGGASFPKTGSNGFGYELLKKLGHTVSEVKPALVPLVISDNLDWKGIRVKGMVSIYHDNILMGSDTGEIQLTGYGISGICVMNISRYFDKTKENILHINFTKDIENINEFIESQNKKLKDRTIIELLESVINYKLLYYLFKVNKIKDIKWNDMDADMKKRVVKTLTDYEVKIKDTLGFEYAEVTSGGVSLDEVTDTCESKIIPNLYITGELLDIDGFCGGYNLTNAWITGLLAGGIND